MNQNFIHATILSFIFAFLFSQSLFAQSKETIYASYKYTLGDSDTKSDSKKIAFIEAKRLCLEKAGTYIESNTEVLNSQLSRDEIKTYTGGFLKVEIVSEQFKAADETLTLFMEVKAEVDLKEVNDNLKRVKSDKKYAAKIREQEKQLQGLEDKIRKMQKQLSSNDFDKTTKIRQERKTVFKKIDELERIRHTIISRAEEVTEKIEAGMTIEDVVKLVGQPRKKDHCLSRTYYNYGKAWIIFQSGIVRCIVPSDSFRGSCSSCPH
jgi:multidrug efflux pump subunit AcrB